MESDGRREPVHLQLVLPLQGLVEGLRLVSQLLLQDHGHLLGERNLLHVVLAVSPLGCGRKDRGRDEDFQMLGFNNFFKKINVSCQTETERETDRDRERQTDRKSVV